VESGLPSRADSPPSARTSDECTIPFLSCCSSSASVVVDMSKPKIAVVYYSLYGHVRTLALEEKRGLEEVGCEVTLRESRRLFFPLARVLWHQALTPRSRAPTNSSA
jgi:hypothetical protein